MTSDSGSAADAPPIAVAQEALWYQSRLAPNRITYNEIISIRKQGDVDLTALRLALNELIARHEAWRTTFDAVGGEPVQVIRPPHRFELGVIDFAHLHPDEAERRAVELIAEVAKVPYDLRRGPLMRPRLIRFPGDEYRLYLAMHHIIFDGVSLYRVILPELPVLYEAFRDGTDPQLEPAPRYADYAAWEQEWITQPRVSRRFDYWRGRLEELPAISLPLDHPRPSEPLFRGGVVPLEVPREVVDRLRNVGLTVGASLFQALATTWGLLLSRYGGQRDVVFATAVDLRQRPEFERVVGCALTPLPLRVDMSDDPSFADLVVRVRNDLLDGLEKLVPFERLVRELTIHGPANANPVYQTMIVLEPAAVARGSQWSIHQMEGEIGNAMGVTKVDLELELDERPEGHISGRLIFDGDLFERETARALVANWTTLTSAAASDPSQRSSEIQLVEASQERRQLIEWNATETERGAAGLADVFQASLAAHADMPAVGPAKNSTTYRDLDRRAHGVAARLRSAGLGPESAVAICAEPSADLLAAMLGVVYAGASYVLVDPLLTADDIGFVLNDAAASAVLADPRVADADARGAVRLPIAEPDDGASAPAVYSTGGEICCLHYARASGGELRGVKLRHASVVNLAITLAEALGLGGADTVLLLRSTLFGAPALDAWLAIAAGARLVVAPSDADGNGARVNELVSAERVSFIHAAPDAWQSLIDTGLRSTRGVKALIAGNGLAPALAEQMLQRVRNLWSGYSSPETSGYATLARVAHERPLAVGRPIANARAYVLDVHGKPLPVGVAGDLWISGAPVAAGYVARSAGTDPAFLDDPFGAGQAVRTGAAARWRSDGLLELLTPPTLSQPGAAAAPGA